MENEGKGRLRADVYLGLAEALSAQETPAWMAHPGCRWPLVESASGLEELPHAVKAALEQVMKVPAESIDRRRERYTTLFAGQGRPRFWLYESAVLSGKLLGPETFAVERWYQHAGLEVEGAEIPDHASLELAFLAHLAGQSPPDPRLETEFIRQHAGRWLPALGGGLSRTGDMVYAPLGELLAGWLEEVVRRKNHKQMQPKPAVGLPALAIPEDCSLCGFCVQVCPAGCLRILDNEYETELRLFSQTCTGCGKCAKICPSNAIALSRAASHSRHPALQAFTPLRRSARVICPECKRATVSRAELDFVSAQLGSPAWLEYCPECRPAFMEIQT